MHTYATNYELKKKAFTVEDHNTKQAIGLQASDFHLGI